MRSKELIGSIVEELRGLKGMRVGILTHVDGDADSIASLFVLKNILTEVIGASVTCVVVPDQISEATERFCERIGLEVSTSPCEADAYVAVDVGSPEQLGSIIRELKGKLIVIDHHEPSRRFKDGVKLYSSPAYQSTSEMIVEVAKKVGYELSREEATLLFAGIYFDTVRLTVADSKTLAKAGELGNAGASPRELLPFVEIPIDYSERIARLKSAMRMELYRCEDVIVAVTRVGAFRSSAARGLLSLGAHVAIVGDEQDGSSDVVLRGSTDVAAKYDLNLVRDVVEPVAKKYGGRGGGHAAAARLKAPAKLNEVLDSCLKHVAFRIGVMPDKVD